MRVCYFIPMLDYTTGWGKWTADLLEYVTGLGVEPVLIIPETQKKFHEELGLGRHETHFWGPEPYLWFHQLHRINFRGLRDLVTVRKNFRLLKETGIELIHAADTYPWGYFAKQLKDELHVPLVLTNHSRPLFNPRFSLIDSRLCRSAVAASDRVVSVSAWSSLLIRQELGMEGEKFGFVHNGVNIDSLSRYAGTTGREYTTMKTGPVILSVTRFIKLKGLETSVLAFKRIKQVIPGARYYIVGPHANRKYVEYIQGLIRENGIQDVFMPGKTGTTEELCAYYRKADVLLHTSCSEAFPLIFYEAGFFRLPIVATAVGGVPEAVIDGENGLLVPEDDDGTQTARALHEILTTPGLAKHLGDNNHEKALSHSSRRVAADYFKIYESLTRQVR